MRRKRLVHGERLGEFIAETEKASSVVKSAPQQM